MKILQLSDFHIDSSIDIAEVKGKLDKMKASLSSRIKPDEVLLICVCGDIIDKGETSLFKKAEIIFDYLKNEVFSALNVKFEFVPGNHDLCNLKFVGFDNFIKKYIEDPYEYNGKANNHLRLFNGINTLLSNSSFKRSYEFGMLDITGLKTLPIQEPTILVTHHTLLSENDADTSAIRNAYKLMEWIESKNVIAIIHGHTHGYKNILIGEKCRVIGVGPFLKQVPDINNQFNLIETSYGRIDKVTNYRFSADLDCFTSHDVFVEDSRNIFTSSSVKELYDQIVQETKHLKSIYNLKANLSSDFNNFEKEIKSVFGDIIPAANDWHCKTVPESLYYNHGQYMQTDSIWSIDYIIGELKNKSTSSRAIIPLINFDMVANSKDRFLPSLDIIQFGFADDRRSELFLTMYLRALEVNHFLKINICEAYIMAKQVKDKIRSIEKINLTIVAFKAQYKEKYGCFRKANIDSVTESFLTRTIYEQNYRPVIEMLEEKIDLSETVIQDHGIEKLKNALLESSGAGKCSAELVIKAETILETLSKLKYERERSSDYIEIERIELDVTNAIRDLIDEFKKQRGVSNGYK